MPTPADQQPDAVSLQPGALLAMIRDLQRRLTEAERQNRMLLMAITEDAHPAGFICLNAACINSTQVPHMAERPYGCPRLA